MARKVSSSSEYSSSTCTPFTPISEMSSVKTPGSDSMVVHSIALERGAARTARSVASQGAFAFEMQRVVSLSEISNVEYNLRR